MASTTLPVTKMIEMTLRSTMPRTAMMLRLILP